MGWRRFLSEDNPEYKPKVMPPKRRRASQDRDGESSSGSTPAPKRKKAAFQFDPMELCQELYETIRNHKTQEGRLLCETFIRVPKRRTDPEYYDVVTIPIDMLKIANKLKSDEYEDIEQLTTDVQLLVNNAKAFYAEESREYRDACGLWDLYTDTKEMLLGEVFGPGATAQPAAVALPEKTITPAVPTVHTPAAPIIHTPREVNLCHVTVNLTPCTQVAPSAVVHTDDADSEATIENDDEGSQAEEGPEDAEAQEAAVESALEAMFAVVYTAKDNSREVCEMFKLLPSKQLYPEYFEIIKDPIDLKIIATKIQNKEYSSLEDMHKDLQLMVANAKIFNEPGSQIYKDAVTLKKIIHSKKVELDTNRSRSGRMRSRRSVAANQKYSAECAALQYDTEEEEENASMDTSHNEEEEAAIADVSVEVTSELDDALWQLFNAVKKHRGQGGVMMAEPFMRLPNRRFYPDYYEDIKRPMSLLKIQKKLKNGVYRHIEKLSKDLEVLFANAQQYNADDSKIYRDSLRLQEVMRKKRKELLKDVSISNDNDIKDTLDQPNHEEFEHLAATPIIRSRRSLEPGMKAFPTEEVLKKRLRVIYKTLWDYQADGRSLIDIFIELPSRRDYPDYYQVISDPIDMNMIDSKLKSGKYLTEQSMVMDLELMFNNARHYNEENSLVYRDAEALEKVLKSKLRALGPLDSPKPKGPAKKKYHSSTTPLSQKLSDLYHFIMEYQDSRKRVLSTPFIKLPTKQEYPDYYEVIKKPIDMQRISQRMLSSQYDSVEDMVGDFVLMFDNACKYNEPDSLIYKDALTLQRLCLEKKQEICADDDTNDVPDVKAALQELMTNLFISTYNHMDEDGRGYSDSFQDMPALPTEDVEKEEASESPRRATPSFEVIKRNLDKGRYRRMDRFQDDMFEVFEHARKVSRSDSQLYEDAMELQMFFIRKRDEVCKNGEILVTPALSYLETHLTRALDAEKKEKVAKELAEEEKKKQEGTEEKEGKNKISVGGSEDSMAYQNETYSLGDFVYVEPRADGRQLRRRKITKCREKDPEPHIVCIEKMWKEESGEQMLYGCWFYRPKETYHLATRKFLQKEIFKSDFYESASFSRVMGRCHVMPVKDYFKMKPEGIPDKDVYVCEFRYSTKHRAFKKIKLWSFPKNDNLNIVARQQPLSPVRVASVFAEKTVEHVADDIPEGEPFILDKKREIISVEIENAEGHTYYEQQKTAVGWFKLGDHVYVRSDEERPFIARVDKIWSDNGGNMYFHGPWYVHPPDVEHSPTRLFYKQEVFRSSIEDTNPLLSIMGRCSVLTYKEFSTSRITEIPERDVYICESKYIEAEKAIKKLHKTTNSKVSSEHRQSLSAKVSDDEVYFFKKPIIPQKEPSPLLLKVSEEPFIDPEEDSQPLPGVSSFNGSFAFNGADQSSLEDTPSEKVHKRERKKLKPWQPSGYLIFSAEYRKQVQEQNPDMTFGEISKIVGLKWREMKKSEKIHYEEKAKRVAEEQAAKQEAADKAFNESLSMYPLTYSPAPDRSMSPATHRAPATGGAPPPSHHQQPRFHLTGYPQQHQPSSGGGYPLTPQNYTPQHQVAPQYHPQQHQQVHLGMPATPVSQGGIGQTPTQVVPQVPARPPSPMFVSVPPRTQRLVHSEAYLRYIEGLSKENRNVSNWERSLTATQENSTLDRNAKLPTHWLGEGPGHHGDTVTALWALRDLMLKDSLTITRTLEFSQL